jgi:AAA15 family ATPase/GTPase
MELSKLIIKNYRCYKEGFEIGFEDLTAIIAKNDVGKSTILEALDVFFNLEKLDSGDRSVGLRNSDNIEITCCFRDVVNELIIDTDNRISPKCEYLLNQDGLLEITKIYSGAVPKCENVVVNCIHPSVEKYNDLLDLKIVQLRARAKELNIDLTDVNQTIKSALRHVIWSNADNLELGETKIEIKATIWKSLQSSLPMYQLFKSDRPSSDQDSEAQDPIKFAIKEAVKDKNKEFEELGEYVKKQVRQVTMSTIEKLREMDPELANQLEPKFSTFNWNKVFSVSLTNENQIPLNKRGSGVRRLFLINFFRARAEQLSLGREVQDVIYAIEEPETSQHPNNQRLLLNALKDLALNDQNQVIYTTHNPVLVNNINQNAIRFIEQCDQNIRLVAPINDETFEKIKISLGMFANHNVRAFVGVEGPNDIEFLIRASKIISQHNVKVYDLGQAEVEGKLVFIPMGGSTLQLWTNRLEGLDVPEVHIMDRDNQPPKVAKYQKAADAVNARGQKAYITDKREMENYLHFQAINECYNLELSSNFNDFDDVPELIAEMVYQSSASKIDWDERSDEFKKKKVGKVKKRLNREVLDCMTYSQLLESDKNQDIFKWLRAISELL